MARAGQAAPGARVSRWTTRLLGGLLLLTAPTVQAQAAADNREAMFQTVRQWVASQQQGTPQEVLLAPLDPRLQLPLCAPGWQVDRPFASPTTVRARCTNPQAQYYLRVLNPGPAQAAAPPALPLAAPPTAPTAATTPSTTPSTQPTAQAPGPADTSANKPPVVSTRQVVVITQSLQRGMRLLPEHLGLAEVDAQGLAANTLQLLDEALNAEASRDLRAGEPLRSSDIRQAVLVKRGQVVLLQLQAQAGFLITARVEALQDGRMGEQIKLKNMESGRMLTGVVNGLNSARGL